MHGIDPRDVPKKRLANGDEIPAVGLGTFGSDKYSANEVADAVEHAIGIGYRHFDCASVYGNEAEIGQVFKKHAALRKDLWITSKVWNDMHDRVEESCERSLRDLGVDYLDLYLVHWPFPNHHAPGVDVSARDPHAVPYRHDRYMKTWAQMERMVQRGLVRHIGASNMTISKLEGLLKDASIKPSANELELHPHFQQPELFRFCQQHDILPIGYSPIGSPSRPERDRTPDDTVDIEDPAIVSAADRLGVHPAVVCVLWQVERGSIPIPFAVKPQQQIDILRAVATMRLTRDEMSAIENIDRNCRLIKGQVFLWEGANDWKDLWT
ncbi:MAG TPA: aldo/keto reductase [Fimbriimonas sp.]|nr:aldo/keto reductase [Fimbriimonas sp.]